MSGQLNRGQIECLTAFFEGLKPTPMQKVSDWADSHRHLASDSAAEAGLWRTSRTPYLKQILDDLSPTSPIERVIFQKSVQLGATETAFNAMGCFIDIAPCPIMYVAPTVELGKSISKKRFDPMVAATPRLNQKIRPARERDSGNTILEKSFPGGLVVFTGSNSAAGLRSRPIRLLIMDEVDAYTKDADGEGSPITLADARTTTYSNRKVYLLSTPTIDGASAIQKEIETTDKRKYHVPLQCCGVEQTLEFSQLKWEQGNPESVRYECAHCGEKIAEREKPRFLSKGRWVATDPQFASPKKTGYMINGLYSPLGWLSWAKIVELYENALKYPLDMITFINTVLGECYKDTSDKPQWDALYARREQYPTNLVPSGVAFLTCGVDVQGDRIELEIVGWGKGRESWSVDYRVIPGDTSKKEVWDKLADLVGESFEHESGGNMPISMLAIDSGHNTTHVYDFCSRFDFSRVIPIKGENKDSKIMVTPPKAVNIMKDGKKAGGVRLWHVNVSMIKTELYANLRLTMGDDGQYPAGYCHFPEYDTHYFKMLTAEELKQSINKRGFREYVWEKKFQRNEALDCRVYARAAAHVMNMDLFKDSDWDKMKKIRVPIAKHGEQTEKPKQKPKKSSFWDK